MPMEITSTPYDRTPRENADARPGLETRWSRPSTMLCAAGSFSSRYRPKPRPSCSANSGVSSFATSPRMSYSRKTCIGMAMAAPLRRSAECTRRAASGQPRGGERGERRDQTAVTLLADEAGIVRVVRVAVVVAGARPVSCATSERGGVAKEGIDVANRVTEVHHPTGTERCFSRYSGDSGDAGRLVDPLIRPVQVGRSGTWSRTFANEDGARRKGRCRHFR